jgi:hypothetical protein
MSKRISSGCPYCSGKKAGSDNSLANRYPEIARQWNYELNKGTTPNNITYGSSKRFWWTCDKDKKHIWRTSPYERKRGSGCPYCSGKRKVL